MEGGNGGGVGCCNTPEVGVVAGLRPFFECLPKKRLVKTLLVFWKPTELRCDSQLVDYRTNNGNRINDTTIWQPDSGKLLSIVTWTLMNAI